MELGEDCVGVATEEVGGAMSCRQVCALVGVVRAKRESVGVASGEVGGDCAEVGVASHGWLL